MNGTEKHEAGSESLPASYFSVDSFRKFMLF